MRERIRKWAGVIEGVFLIVAGAAAAHAVHTVRYEIVNSAKTLSASAESHATVLGSLAGFVATIVALLLAINPSDEITAERERARIGSVAAFMCSFLTAIIASASYAHYSGLGWWLDSFGPAQQVTVGRIAALMLGAGYFVTIMLTFFGLVLAVSYLAPYKELEGLARFMLTIAYLVGTARTVLEVAIAQSAIDPRLLAVLWLLPMGLALALPSTWPKKPESVVDMLYASLMSCLLLVTLMNVAYHLFTKMRPASVDPQSLHVFGGTALVIAIVITTMPIPLLVIALDRTTALCQSRTLKE